jgi:hypothetical protein
LKDEPLEILRAVLMRYGGRASNVTVRNALMQIGVDGNAWSSWWKKTRPAGREQRVVPRLRQHGRSARSSSCARAIDPVERCAANSCKRHKLKDALARVRDLLGGAKLEDRSAVGAGGDRQALPPRTTSRWRSAWARGCSCASTAARRRSRCAIGSRRLAAEATPTDPSTASDLWALLQRIQGAREQEKSIELLPEIYGDEWMDEALANLTHATPGDGQAAGRRRCGRAGRNGDLARWYTLLLARPTRAPFVLIELARLAESGELPGTFPHARCSARWR